MSCFPSTLTSLKRLIRISVTAALLLPSPARAEATPEYKLKAAYLFNFVRFAQWPTNAFAAADSPLVIGVLGDNPFEGELEKLVSGRPVGGRKVVVKQVANVEDAKACHAVFIPASEQGNVRRHLETLRTGPVLTIGESPELLDAGGIIRFFIEEKKIRFEINKGQADAEGLQLDSQLLSLAKSVQEKTPGGPTSLVPFDGMTGHTGGLCQLIKKPASLAHKLMKGQLCRPESRY